MIKEEKREGEKWVKSMVDSYKPKIWKNFLQKFWFWLTEFFTPVFKYRDKRNKELWEIIQPYRRKIVEAYREHERYSNEKDPNSATLKANINASDQIRNLTAELQQKLNEARWPYRSLPDYRDLVFFQDGNIVIDNAMKYWKEVANFFLHRPFHLLN